MTAGDLKEFCSERDGSYDLSKPHAFEYEGKIYSYATDGHRMVVVDGLLDGLALYPTLSLDKFLIEPQGVDVDGEALKTFLGCGKPTVVPCEKCEGTGKIEHDCDCRYCTTTEPEPCYCEGKRRRITNYGWLGIVPLNLALVAEPMRTCTDKTVRIHITGKEDRLHIFASDRHILCMPMRECPQHEHAPRFEVPVEQIGDAHV